MQHDMSFTRIRKNKGNQQLRRVGRSPQGGRRQDRWSSPLTDHRSTQRRNHRDRSIACKLFVMMPASARSSRDRPWTPASLTRWSRTGGLRRAPFWHDRGPSSARMAGSTTGRPTPSQVAAGEELDHRPDLLPSHEGRHVAYVREFDKPGLGAATGHLLCR